MLSGVLIEAADLFDDLKSLILRTLQTLQQPIKLKAHRRVAGKSFKLAPHDERPLAASRSERKLKLFEQQQD
jgi:hypothetical protein